MKPIIFSTPMVQAVLAANKTQTRRIVQNQNGIHPRWNNIGWLGWDDGHGRKMRQPYTVGDTLWVRETWSHPSQGEIENGAPKDVIVYKADPLIPCAWDKWRSPVSMPRSAARLYLNVTDLRAERLQDITGHDVIREGIHSDWLNGEGERWDRRQRELFQREWNSLYALRGYGWVTNPWVWVISFKQTEKPEVAE